MNDSTPSDSDFNPTEAAIVQPSDATPPAVPGADLSDDEVIRVELFETVPTIHRETVIREKVQIRKISTSENS